MVTRYTSSRSTQVTIIVSPCWPASTTNQSGLVALTFDLESGVRVTCDVGYLCANFGLPRPLCFRLRPDVRDRQTDVRQKHRLMPRLLGAGRNNAQQTCMTEDRLHTALKPHKVSPGEE